jgi:hypothetical protein
MWHWSITCDVCRWCPNISLARSASAWFPRSFAIHIEDYADCSAQNE